MSIGEDREDERCHDEPGGQRSAAPEVDTSAEQQRVHEGEDGAEGDAVLPIEVRTSAGTPLAIQNAPVQLMVRWRPGASCGLELTGRGACGSGRDVTAMAISWVLIRERVMDAR